MTRPWRYVLLVVLALAVTAAPAQAQWVVTPYLGVNTAGDAETGKGGPGVSAGYLSGRLGFEFDLQRYQHFFKDAEIVPLDPAAPPNCAPGISGPCTDIDTDALSVMGNVVVSTHTRGAQRWWPYGTAGLGLIRAWTNEDRSQNDFGWNIGGGVLVSLSRRIALRGDLRYFRALVDESRPDNVSSRDYDFLRASLGVTFGFPQ